ncbi:hypothetical protein B0A69_15370 [Chryseobacterium shigense]|uniref:Head domain of trimeric autotransporter adhesin n=1 Tax=Chryseobacterium shigense TaxID=297244 RepID=A0A1N7IU88_9FLAO|nr:hypothetical protein [Chryseobacterium shigense]PQA92414.1 hypothetical protein B0A69_15370 [Chryseobacterium shigense]SIS40658.1 hypothetical protein SAMN05421639_104579 [Chryseobacterium shigense]
MKNKLFTIAAMSLYFGVSAQVGINTNQPQATLDVVGFPLNTGKLDGIIAPRLVVSQLGAKTYTTAQTGALVYVTVIDTVPSNPQTASVTAPGYYYFDGAVWQKQTGTEWQVKGNAAGEISTSAETLGVAPVSGNYLGPKGSADLVMISANKVHAVLNTAGGLSGGGENASNLSWGSSNTVNSTSNNIALGRGNTATASAANFPGIAIGSGNTATAGGQVFGAGNSAVSSNNFAFGGFNKTGNSVAVAVGYSNDASNGGFAFGANNNVTLNNFAFGSNNTVSGTGSVAIGINGTSVAAQSTYANTSHVFSGQGNVGTVITDVGINVTPSSTNYADLEISKALQIKASAARPTCDSSNAGSILYEVTTTLGVTSGTFIGCRQTGNAVYGWQNL